MSKTLLSHNGHGASDYTLSRDWVIACYSPSYGFFYHHGFFCVRLCVRKCLLFVLAKLFLQKISHDHKKVYAYKSWWYQVPEMAKLFRLNSSNLCISCKIQNMFGHMSPLWCHMILLLGLPGYRAIVWRWSNWNVHSIKVNYCLKIQGRKNYKSTNSSPWKYKLKKSRDQN